MYITSIAPSGRATRGPSMHKLIIPVLATLVVVMATVVAPAHAGAIEPNPAYGQRRQVCHQFEISRPEICNFATLTTPTGRENCPPVGGRLVCYEESPAYNEQEVRLKIALLSCGEELFACQGAYFLREGSDCVYHVVGNGDTARSYEVRLSDLPNERRILLVRSDNGNFQRYGRNFIRQRNDAVRAQLQGWSLVPVCY